MGVQRQVPNIFEHRDYGPEARKLYDDALVIRTALSRTSDYLRGVGHDARGYIGDDIKLETPEGPLRFSV